MKPKSTPKERALIRWLLFVVWFVIVTQLIYSNIRSKPLKQSEEKSFEEFPQEEDESRFNLITSTEKQINSVNPMMGDIGIFSIMFAEAKKKKNKSKSEVVVISVNSPAKGHGGMYPVYIPTCGGHGRRKRSLSQQTEPRMPVFTDIRDNNSP